MFTITTTFVSTGSGSTNVVAKGNGRQRTIHRDLERSAEWNHAAAAGTLLNVLADDLQRAKVRHPSGASRVRVESLSDAGGKMRFTIDV